MKLNIFDTDNWHEYQKKVQTQQQSNKQHEFRKVEPIKIENTKILKPLNLSNFPVFSAKINNDLTKTYAIKMMQSGLPNSQPFESAVPKLLRINHPNVIKIYNYERKIPASISDKPDQKVEIDRILMEYAPYGDLGSIMREGAIPQSEKFVRTIFHHLIEGIEYLHLCKIYHLNLRLDDLVIGKGHNVKILNYGFPHKPEAALNYAAPELVYKKKIENEAACDVYSAGIILFLLKFHLFPYVKEENSEDTIGMFETLMHSHEVYFEKMEKYYGNRFKGSTEFKNLFLRMTCRDPKSRISIKEI